MASIFRESSVQRLATPDRLDQALRVTDPTGWLALGALITLILVAAGASFAIAVPVKVLGDGIIITPAGLFDVSLPNPGRILEIMVRSGDRVAAGAAVARLEQPETKQELAQAQADERDLREQRERLVAFQSSASEARERLDLQRLDDLAQSVRLVKQRLVWLHEREKADAELTIKGLTTKKGFVETKIEIGRAEEEIATNESKLTQIDVDAKTRRIDDGRELWLLDVKLSQAERRIDRLIERLARESVVTSLFSGTVVEIKLSQGDVASRGAGLLSVLPDEDGNATRRGRPLVAMLYVPAVEGKKLRVGMIAEVAPSTVQREEFGFMLGHIRAVAELPSTEEGMMRTLKNHQLASVLSLGGAPFEVEVELESDTKTPSGYRWSSSRGPKATISPGTLCSGKIWTRNESLAAIVVPALRRVIGEKE